MRSTAIEPPVTALRVRTRAGHTAVLIGMDEWESIQETRYWLSQAGIRDTIAEAEVDIAAGRTHAEEAIRGEFGVPKRHS